MNTRTGSETRTPQLGSCEIAVRVVEVVVLVVEVAEDDVGEVVRMLDEEDVVDVDLTVDVTEVELGTELEVELTIWVARVPSNAVANTSVPFTPPLVAMVVARADAL
jgi:hypothetical protein